MRRALLHRKRPSRGPRVEPDHHELAPDQRPPLDADHASPADGRVGRGRRVPAPYEASGVCYAEFGDGLVSKVEVSFLGGDAPAAQRYDPSLEYAAEKEEFGAVRRARWFGRS